MTTIRKLGTSLLVAVFMAALGGFHAARGDDDVAMEVVVTKAKAGVSLDALLAADKAMEQQFVVKQKGFIDRSVGISKDGMVIVIARWRSLADAEAAGAAVRNDPAAKRRVEMSEIILIKDFVVK